MADQGRITGRQARRAGRVEIRTRAYPVNGLDGRYFRDFIRAGVSRKLPGRGVAVYTTLDASLQRAAERAVRGGMDRRFTRGAEAALVALDPRTGEVLAMVGGRDYRASQFNRATDARRQPGSAFAGGGAAALERREDQEPAFTLASVLEDEPLRVRTPQGAWHPTNYDRQFHGRVTLRQAMEESLNVPFARIGLVVGPQHIVETARRVGITSPLHAVPSLALGSSEVTLKELVRPTACSPPPATSPSRVWCREGGMAKVRGYGLGGGRPDGGSGRRVAGDLGARWSPAAPAALNEDGGSKGLPEDRTSNDWRDAWFGACTPSLVVESGSGLTDGGAWPHWAAAALPIVARFLDEAAQEGLGVVRDAGWNHRRWVTYADAGDDWNCGEREYFLEGTEPAGGSCGAGPPVPGGAAPMEPRIATGARDCWNNCWVRNESDGARAVRRGRPSPADAAPSRSRPSRSSGRVNVARRPVGPTRPGLTDGPSTVPRRCRPGHGGRWPR
jgi:membrane peptidoglycan carboxypeptidase